MLQLKNIRKTYRTGELVQQALDGVSLDFRDNEFVAILGPSGSGKTTLLNIIGGLDCRDEGELLVDGLSTQTYSDRDWDSYRNHTIGFVFQNYNLIPHQSVLANVELALTIGGISRRERRRRAEEALERVGLKEHMRKRPSQLSGGQMQRVAIARALVGDPRILLADEPTGALDSETGLQVMELLKEVARDRLVIMVTHNGELAEAYASRIIKLKDGRIILDSDPFNGGERIRAVTRVGKKPKASMSWGTSLSLSFSNLKTKLGRSLLTAFAGSIGIIGIALILSLSTGADQYIQDIQRDTMTSYPITVEAVTLDLSGWIDMARSNREGRNKAPDHGMDGVYSDNTWLDMRSSLSSSITENNLTRFKAYLDDPASPIHEYLGENGVVYSYDLPFNVYTYDSKGLFVDTDDLGDGGRYYMGGMGGLGSGGTYATGHSAFEELLPDRESGLVSSVVRDKNELLAGSWPERYDQLVLMVDENQELSLRSLFALGYLSREEYRDISLRLEAGEEVSLPQQYYRYEDLLGKRFYLLPAWDLFEALPEGGYRYLGGDPALAQTVLDRALELTVCGIVRAKTESSALGSAPLGYTRALTDHLMAAGAVSPLLEEQEATPEINIINGRPFDEADETGWRKNGSLKDNQQAFGLVSVDAPASISLYCDSFEAKEQLGQAIAAYNETVPTEDQITYTDYVGLLMSSVTTIIDVISVVLIAFVAVSLVVSSIMIGIITYISVLERTREIGVLRALGASKGNISQVFNAETLIIGLASGLMGIGIALLILIPGNQLIRNLAGEAQVRAFIRPLHCLILIFLSTLLTLIGGFIPSKKAARRDPVAALRSD